MHFLQVILQSDSCAFGIAFVRNICFNFVLLHQIIVLIKIDHFVHMLGSYLNNPRTDAEISALRCDRAVVGA